MYLPPPPPQRQVGSDAVSILERKFPNRIKIKYEGNYHHTHTHVTAKSD